MCAFVEDTFSLKAALVVVVPGMTEMLTRVVGWIVCGLDGCRGCCSIQSLCLTDSNRGWREELRASEDIDQQNTDTERIVEGNVIKTAAFMHQINH